MEVFRICKEEHSRILTSSGVANRWNLRGQNVMYTGSSRSLATLELVVHRSAIVPSYIYKVLVISIADDDRLITQIHLADLPRNWRTLSSYSTLQEIGANWYITQRTLVLKVPSAIIPFEFNYIINAEHPDFNNQIQLVRTEDYFWDNRLF